MHIMNRMNIITNTNNMSRSNNIGDVDNNENKKGIKEDVHGIVDILDSDKRDVVGIIDSDKSDIGNIVGTDKENVHGNMHNINSMDQKEDESEISEIDSNNHQMVNFSGNVGIAQDVDGFDLNQEIENESNDREEKKAEDIVDFEQEFDTEIGELAEVLVSLSLQTPPPVAPTPPPSNPTLIVIVIKSFVCEIIVDI